MISGRPWKSSARGGAWASGSPRDSTGDLPTPVTVQGMDGETALDEGTRRQQAERLQAGVDPFSRMRGQRANNPSPTDTAPGRTTLFAATSYTPTCGPTHHENRLLHPHAEWLPFTRSRAKGAIPWPKSASPCGTGSSATGSTGSIWARPGSNFYDAPDEALVELGEEARGHGLEIGGLTVLRKIITWPAPEEVRATNRGLLSRAVKAAGLAGAPLVNMSISPQPWEVGVREQDLRGQSDPVGSSLRARDEDYEEAATVLKSLARGGRAGGHRIDAGAPPEQHRGHPGGACCASSISSAIP